jgi:hypothetical protein
MSNDLVIFTKDENKIPADFMSEIMCEKKLFFFLDEATKYINNEIIKMSSKDKLLAFCSFGLKKNMTNYSSNFLVTGLSYLSKLIEDCSKIYII